MNKLSQLSDEILIKETKKRKINLIIQIILFLIITISCLVITQKDGFTLQTLFPLAFLALLALHVSNYNRAKKEMNARNLKP